MTFRGSGCPVGRTGICGNCCGIVTAWCRLRLVIVASSCRFGLTGPKHSRVLGMSLFKRSPVLCVPRIVECPHELKIVQRHMILPKLHGSAPSAVPPVQVH